MAEWLGCYNTSTISLRAVPLSFILAALLVISFAVISTSIFKLTSRAVYLTSLFVTAWSNVILVAEFTSLLHSISKLSLLMGHGVLTLVAALVWIKSGKPNLSGPFQTIFQRGTPRGHLIRFVITQVRDHPWISLLGAVSALCYLLGLVFVFAVPPNTVDAMTYHLARASYWLQQGSFDVWTTNNPRQTSFPINTDIGLMWLLLFTRSDRWVGLIQWISGLAAGISIYGAACVLNAKRSQALFAVLVWLAFPQIIFQSSSTQNDLATAAIFMSGIFFFLYGLKTSRQLPIFLSGLAIGIAIGAKTTIILILPALALGVLLILIQKGRGVWPLLIRWAASLVVSFAIFGAYNYIQNWLAYGNPFTVSRWVDQVATNSSRLNYFAGSLSMHFYQFIDFSGLPDPIAQYLLNGKAALADRVINAAFNRLSLSGSLRTYFPASLIHQPVIFHEDLSWFGPLGFILLTWVTIRCGAKAVRNRDMVSLFPIVLAIGFYITISFLLFPTMYRGRYFVLPVTVMAPFLAFLYRPGHRGSSVAAIISLTSIFMVVHASLWNPSKPVFSQQPFWKMDRVQLQTINRKEMDPVIRMVETQIAPDAPMGLKTGQEGWDYIFFGPRLERTVMPVESSTPASEFHDLASRGIEYLLVEPGERNFLRQPAGLEWVNQINGWTLFRFTSEPTQLPAAAQTYLEGAEDSSGLIRVDETLHGRVGVVQAGSLHWGIEVFENAPLLWIGEGQEEGLIFHLVSEEEQDILITFSVQPGPGLPGNQRTFNLLEIQAQQVVVSIDQSVSGTSDVTFLVHVVPGIQRFVFSSRDFATVRSLPNGDKRPLLARLNGVRIHQEP